MNSHRKDRRHFLRRAVQLTASGLVLPFSGMARAELALPVKAPALSFGTADATRSLAFNHLHTNEQIELVYAVNQTYVPRALSSLNWFLRDHYSGQMTQMDPQLFDVLHQLRLALDSKALPAFDVISGYRSPDTNKRLRLTRHGGVAKHSLHMQGKAIDVRLPGVPLNELRDVALSLELGGVGFYPTEDFVHLDTGDVRHWG